VRRRARAALSRAPLGEAVVQRRSRSVQISQIIEGHLFDLEWYHLQTTLRFRRLRAAVAHYIDHGMEDGLSPNPLFEPAWFDEDRDDQSRIDPLARYLRGEWRARSPHPCFDSQLHVARSPASARHRGGPLGHFLETASAGTDVPSPVGTETWGHLRARLVAGELRVAEQWALREPRIVETWDDARDHAVVRRWSEVPVPSGDASPLVSIVMPVRNRPTQVLIAIASVRAQTMGDWELLVVDDGSTDRTAEAVAHVAASDPRITLVPGAFGGAAAARNAGLDRARGRYVAFLDSDNAWVEHFLQVMTAAMHEQGLRAAYSAAEFRSPNSVRYLAYEGDLDHLLVTNHIDLNALVVERALIDDSGHFDVSLRRMIDWDLVLRVAEHHLPTFVPFVGVLYDEDPSLTDRISSTESYRWTEVVQSRHLIDWTSQQRQLAGRTPGLTSVVIDTFQDWRGTIDSVDALLALPAEDVEIVVLDDGSDRTVHAMLNARYGLTERVVVHRVPRHGRRALAGSITFTRTHGDVVVWLRPGVRPMPGWCAPLRRLLEDPSVAVAVPIVVDSTDVVVEAGRVRTRGALPHAFLCGHPRDDVRGLDPLVPDAVGDLAFAVRAADVVAVEGFECLFAGELYATEFAWRVARRTGGDLRAALDSVVVLDPAPRPEEPPSPEQIAARVAADTADAAFLLGRWGSSAPATATDAWRSAGFELEHLEPPVTPPYEALRPVVVAYDDRRLGVRWVLRLTDPSDALESWARALADELRRRGLQVVVVDRAADHRGSRYLDDVVVHVGDGDRRAIPGRLNVKISPATPAGAGWDVVVRPPGSVGPRGEVGGGPTRLPEDLVRAAQLLISAVESHSATEPR